MPYKITNITSNMVPIMVLNKEDSSYKQVNLGASETIEMDDVNPQIDNLVNFKVLNKIEEWKIYARK